VTRRETDNGADQIALFEKADVSVEAAGSQAEGRGY
jgi:hypothetical protein